ncbi:uncharacterized protein LOC141910662 [Tubulanus polymorphus]|uniref:uncharacterized protein LOC141910662 n=1 Tax=Tubulanus polymorphus TaxID=672921 RepID=UPI003DA2A236
MVWFDIPEELIVSTLKSCPEILEKFVASVDEVTWCKWSECRRRNRRVENEIVVNNEPKTNRLNSVAGVYRAEEEKNEETLTAEFLETTDAIIMSLNCKSEEESAGFDSTVRQLCHHCDFECAFRLELSGHLLSEHSISMKSCSTCDDVLHEFLLERSTGDDDPISCKICSLRFKYLNDFHDHLIRHSKREANPESINDFSGDDQQGALIDGGQFECAAPDCRKRFPTRSRLERHLDSHTGIKRWQCDECGKKFAQKCHLKGHLKIHSGSKRPGVERSGSDVFYSCDSCGKLFPTVGRLRRHSVVHDRIKPFLCDACGKSFSQKCHLTGHRRVACRVLNKKQRRCSICDKQFKSEAYLQRHLAAVHSHREG